MDSLHRHLKEDFDRICKQIPQNDLDLPKDYIGIIDVLKAHYFICDYFEDKNNTTSVYGVRDLNLLGSAIYRQFTGFDGKVKWQNKLDIIATLFFGIIKNHAFYDGNKRTGLLILIYYMFISGYMINCTQMELETLTVNVAGNELTRYRWYKQYENSSDKEVLCISHFLKHNSHKAENKYKNMTFQEFDQKLRKYDCFLKNPKGNYIDVFKIEKKILGKKKEVKIMQIGFPSWKNQIGAKAFKEVLKQCKLTKKDGIDTDIFLKGNEPMYKLIQDYEGPLKRLKDK